MGDTRHPSVNVYTLLFSVGSFSLGLSALGWVAMQWHQHLYKIGVERLTQQVREECGIYAEQEAMDNAKNQRLDYPEAHVSLKEGWYSRDDSDRYYKTCVETTPPTAEALHFLEDRLRATLSEVDKPAENQSNAPNQPIRPGDGSTSSYRSNAPNRQSFALHQNNQKFCPVGGELYSAEVKFCPVHGVELRDKQ